MAGVQARVKRLLAVIGSTFERASGSDDDLYVVDKRADASGNVIDLLEAWGRIMVASERGRIPRWMEKHVRRANSPFSEQGPTAYVVWLSPAPRVEPPQVVSTSRQRASSRPRFNAKDYVTFEDWQAPQQHPEKRR